MKPMFPVVTVGSQGANPGNDNRHNKVEPTNQSGGPSTRTRRMIPPKSRGGTGQHGQRRTSGSMSGTAKPTASNPAGRGGAVGSFRPDADNRNKGGGVTARTEHRGMPRNFGTFGKSGVRNDYGHANPQPTAGNVSGRMAKRVSGHFTNKTKKSPGGAGAGSFGSMPVTEDVQ